MTVIDYELWDMESANRLGAFTSLDDALALVSEMLRCDGPEAIVSLGLGAIHRSATGDVELHPMMDGRELLATLSAKTRAS